ncbi:hypothetical protein ACQKWADRAFT_322996 [Trichoderma austrokoningii]
MRLINASTFAIEEFSDFCVPRYAILSHTWGPDSEEISFRDVEEGNIEKPGTGALKFQGCCRQAVKDGLDYAWIDTCCIDKTNLVELSEAINSMFRWYQQAAVCYAFLSDVPSNDSPQEKGSMFQKSRWFQRGWTLQELVAPKILRFYGPITSAGTSNTNMAQEWHLLGTKGSMSTTIASVTGIPPSVAQRMSWAAHRETNRKEDLAYCLLGIFNITMPMIYGEGGDQAFFRLQEQIMKVIKDDSILAWGIAKTQSVNKMQFANKMDRAMAGRVMAKTPLDFANSGHIILDISGGSMFGLLSCGPENNAQQVVGIPLIKTLAGLADEFIRPRGCSLSLHSITLPATAPKQIQIKHDGHESAPIDSDVLYFHYEDKDFSDINLRVIDVVPRSCWDEERSLIISTSIDGNTPHQMRIRLRNEKSESEDFILVLKYGQCDSETLAECMVLKCNRNIPSKDRNSPSMMKTANIQKESNNDLVQPIFVIRPEAIAEEIFTTTDTTAELKEKTLIRETLRLLDESEMAEKSNKDLESRINIYDDNLKRLKKEQDEISAKIKALEMAQKALRSIVSSKRVETERILKDTSDQWESIQNQWNKLRHADEPFISIAGLTEVVRHRLGEGAESNTADKDGSTPLIAASEYGHVEVARLLLDKGETPLILASAAGCYELAEDAEGITPLIAASFVGHVDTVQLLLDYGARMETTTKENGHDDVAQLLFDRSTADDDVEAPVAASNNGKACSHFARMKVFDPSCRNGQYYNDEGLTDGLIHENQSHVHHLLKEKQAKLRDDPVSLYRFSQQPTPPPSPKQIIKIERHN